MKFNFTKTCFVAFLSLFLCTSVFAFSADTNSSRNYIIRITSTIKGNSISVAGTYMTTYKGGTFIQKFNKNTPIELNEKASFIGGIFHSLTGMNTKSDADHIKVEYLYKDSNGEHSLMSGTGFAILGHTDSNGNGDITAA